VLSRYLERLRSTLARPSGRFLGETSYAVYLLHLAVVLPVAGTLAQHAWYVRESAWIRFTLCALPTFTIVYPISWLLYSTVERRGIQWGKRAVALMHRRVPGVGTDAV
jgi:peptidoglycan/LPS O-acetylase OafA/YrhL